MIVTYQLEDSDIATVKDAAQSWYGLTLTDDDVRAVFEDKEFCQQYDYWGMDTCIREQLIDQLVKLVGVEGSWPINGASDVEKLTFYGAFWPAALNRGWITQEEYQSTLEWLRSTTGYASLQEMTR